MASSDADRRDENDEQNSGEDEDTGAQVAPIVRLEAVAVTTGEENEEILFDMKSKLYRYDKASQQWKERGVGSLKLLKHKESGKVRLVMRQAKTHKICANHYVFPSIKVQEHAGNDKSCVWRAPDFADGELKDETFCVRFGSEENCRNFMEMIEEIAQSQESKPESADATEATELLEKLKVGEISDKERDEEKEKDKDETSELSKTEEKVRLVNQKDETSEPPKIESVYAEK